MCRPPSEQSVKAVLGTVFPDVTIERIQAIPSPRLQRLYEVTKSDGRIIHLVMSPSTRLRLLRSEHFMIPAEALAVRWIRNELSKEHPEERRNKYSSRQTSPSNAGTGSLSLRQLVPSLIHLSPGTNELGSVCSFFEPVQGTPIALVPGLLSPEERQQVDAQVGRMFRDLAHLTSPTGRFGPSATCLSASPSSSPRRQLGGGVITFGAGSSSSKGSTMAGSTEGVDTWSGAFHLMLEGILRDGEDMAVMISYSAIRRHFKRLRHLLDLITVPRLVVIDGADESNVLVSSLPSPPPPSPPPSPRTTTTTPTTAPRRSTSIPISSIITQATSIQLDVKEEPEFSSKKEAATSTSTKDEKSAGEGGSKEDGGSMVFTGLRDWSTSFFGDPLIATVFSDGGPPSSSFLKGFNEKDNQSENDIAIPTTEPPTSSPPLSSSSSALPPPTITVPHPIQDLNEALIEHPETAHIRQLLYQVYHATVIIIKEFYRPRGGNESSRRELEGRKKLTEALARLEQVQDRDIEIGKILASAAHSKRSYGIARLSGEMSPAKRIKDVGEE